MTTLPNKPYMFYYIVEEESKSLFERIYKDVLVGFLSRICNSDKEELHKKYSRFNNQPDFFEKIMERSIKSISVHNKNDEIIKREKIKKEPGFLRFYP